MTTKKNEWLAKGAPEQITDFLDAAVATMHTKAVTEDYLHKDNDGNADGSDPVAAGMSDVLDVGDDSVTKDTDTADVEGPEASEDTDTQESTADDVENDNNDDNNVESNTSLQKAFGDMLTASLETYHEVVVAPLQARITELESLNKDKGDSNLNVINSIGLLPPALAAESIRKAFSVASDDTDEGNIEATQKELGDAVTDVSTEDEDLAPTSNASVNLLTGF